MPIVVSQHAGGRKVSPPFFPDLSLKWLKGLQGKLGPNSGSPQASLYWMPNGVVLFSLCGQVWLSTFVGNTKLQELSLRYSAVWQEKEKQKEKKFTLFSDHNGSHLRQQPGAMTIGHGPKGKELPRLSRETVLVAVFGVLKLVLLGRCKVRRPKIN